MSGTSDNGGRPAWLFRRVCRAAVICLAAMVCFNALVAAAFAGLAAIGYVDFLTTRTRRAEAPCSAARGERLIAQSFQIARVRRTSLRLVSATLSSSSLATSACAFFQPSSALPNTERPARVSDGMR